MTRRNRLPVPPSFQDTYRLAPALDREVAELNKGGDLLDENAREITLRDGAVLDRMINAASWNPEFSLQREVQFLRQAQSWEWAPRNLEHNLLPRRAQALAREGLRLQLADTAAHLLADDQAEQAKGVRAWRGNYPPDHPMWTVWGPVGYLRQEYHVWSLDQAAA